MKDKIRIHNNQDFNNIRDECLSNPKRLWEDTAYTAIFDGRSDYEWKRPLQISENAQFMMADRYGTPTRFDLSKIYLGKAENYQFSLATLSALTLHPWLFRVVVPDSQNFNDSKYAGICHFRFWKFGKWYDVVVDDLLPTKNGKLVSHLGSDQPEEYWVFLFEKAFTKFFGHEESFAKSSFADVLVNLTGGVPETWKSQNMGHWDTDFPDIGSIIFNALERESIIMCRHYTSSRRSLLTENAPPRGTYCINKAVYLNERESKNIMVLRFFNPFKSENEEWSGPWSKNSKEWGSIPEKKKKKIGLICEHDGEFWMPLSECAQSDWILNVVNINPDHVTSWMEKPIKIKCWHSNAVEGKWVKGVSSGGSYSEPDLSRTFKLNPQYHLHLTADQTQPVCTVLISLLQKSHIQSRVNMFYYVFTIVPEKKPLDTDFFQNNHPVVVSPPPQSKKARELGKRHAIPPGDYCIVCATQSNSEASYILQIFTEHPSQLDIIDERITVKDMDTRASLRLSVVSADDISKIHQSDESVRTFFETVSGENKVVGWKGLKKVLDYAMAHEKPTTNKHSYSVRKSIISYVFPYRSVFDTMENKEFSKDVTRCLLSMADSDHSGKLTYEEFRSLWEDIREWIAIYETHSDENGYLTKNRLREAIESEGYQLSIEVLGNLAIRYASKDDRIPFDDFVMCMCKLKNVFEYFKQKDPNDTNKATFSFDEWIQKSICS